jgi:hypothetical protein
MSKIYNNNEGPPKKENEERYIKWAKDKYNSLNIIYNNSQHFIFEPNHPIHTKYEPLIFYFNRNNSIHTHWNIF